MVLTLPNTLSLLRIGLSPLFFALFISPDPILRQLSLIVFFLAAMTDWYDGVLARNSNQITNLGKFLDPLADKFLTSAAFIAFAFIHSVEWWMVIIIIVRDIAITILRSIAEARNAPIVTSKSAQWKTFIQMTVLYYLLLLIVGREIGWVKGSFLPAVNALLDPVVVFSLMLAVTLLTLFTGVQYIYENRAFIAGVFRASRHATE